MSTVLDDRPKVSDPNSGDDEVLAHIVKAPPGKSAKAYVVEAGFVGFEVEALCGYRWIPQRDPERYPVCQACVDIYHQQKGL